MKLIERHLTSILTESMKHFPVVAVTGPRQCGKSTLIRNMLRNDRGYVHLDLERQSDLQKLDEAEWYLQTQKGKTICLDEVQRKPEIFMLIRSLVDEWQINGSFIILGSASRDLLRQSSESLAGRIFYHEIGGFTLKELGAANHEKLWFRGSLPRSYLARSLTESNEWRKGFIRTFLERDLPQLGISINSTTMRRFWTMLAHYHGQVWNSSEFARSFGVADTTIRGYLDRLTSALVVRQLLPWHENISKRQIKSPKVYIADSGLLHSLLNIRSMSDLESHPKTGASWEGFLPDQIIRHLHVDREECFFWATHGGAELDLLVVRGRLRLGFEFKRTSSPHVTPSMRQSIKDLGLQRLDVIHAGSQTFPISENVRAVAPGSARQ